MTRMSTKRRILIAITVLAAVAIVYGVNWYQPVRHVIYNDTARDVLLMEEHTSLTVPAGQEKDAGGPRWVRFLSGTEPMIGKIEFKGDGAVKYYFPYFSYGAEVRPPESWSHDRYLWREFHYRYDTTGALSLIPPPQITAGAAQPAGFPICLYRINVNGERGVLTSSCGQPPSPPAR